MLNHEYKIISTNILKAFFSGLILLIGGLVFFNLRFTRDLLVWSLILGFIHALSSIGYYIVLKSKNAGETMPFFQSSSVLFIFLGSVIVFNEFVTIFNYIGIVLILIGVYLLLVESSMKHPKLDRVFLLILLLTILSVISSLMVKELLFNVEPMNLAITIYFSATVILVGCQVVLKKPSSGALSYFKPRISKIISASFFGAMGTFFLYLALSVGNASKVYPIAGLNSIFVFIIASIFLREKFYWHKLIGTVIVVGGIFLISL